MMLPPRWFRRPVAPLLLTGLLIVSIAVLVVCAVPVGLASIRWETARRLLRLLASVPVVMFVELAALAAALGLWLVRADEERTYRVLGRCLRVLVRTASRLLALRLDAEVRAWPGSRLTQSTHARLILCRHAGPGDSLVVLDSLISRYGLRPRIVMKESVRLDPVVDAYFERLPAVFVASRADNDDEPATDAIRRMAGELGSGDALVMFPEGGNYTPRRHRRAVRRLARRGHLADAARAIRMRHVMPPRPGGVLAVLEAATVDVLLIGHSGLGDIHSIGDAWRCLDRPKSLALRAWFIPADDVPAERKQRIDWLFGRWAMIDKWVDSQSAHGGGPTPPVFERPGTF